MISTGRLLSLLLVYTEYTDLCRMLQMLTFLFRFKYLEYIFLLFYDLFHVKCYTFGIFQIKRTLR